MKLFFKILLGAIISIIALFALTVIIVKNIDYNKYKYLIEEQVEAMIGQKLVMNGPLLLLISTCPRIIIEDVALENADWAKEISGEKNMITLGKADITIDLTEIFSQNILHIVDVDISDFVLLLQEDDQGRKNIDFEVAEAYQTAESEEVASGNSNNSDFDFIIPLIHKLHLKNISVQYRSPDFSGVDTFLLEDLLVGDDGLEAGGKRVLTLNARAGEFPITAKADFDHITQLLDPNDKWNVTFDADIATVKVNIAGHIQNIFTGEGTDIRVTAKSDEIGNLTALTAPFSGPEIPNFGPVSVGLSFVANAAEEVAIELIDIRLGQDENLKLAVFGNVKNILDVSDLDLKIEANIASLKSVMDMLKIKSPISDPSIDLGSLDVSFNISGDLEDEISAENINVKVKKDDIYDFSIEGNVGNIHNVSDLDLKIGASILSLKSIMETFEVKLPLPDPSLELGSLVASLDISGDLDGKISGENIKITVKKDDIYDFEVEGRVGDALNQKDFDMALHGTIKEVSKLSPYVGHDLPDLGQAVLTTKGHGDFSNKFTIDELDFFLRRDQIIRLGIFGKVENALTFEQANFDYELDLKSLSLLGQAVNQPMPDWGRIGSAGRLEGTLNEYLSLKNFQLSVGESDVAGNLRVTSDKGISKIKATLQSEKILMVDFKLDDVFKEATRTEEEPEATSPDTDADTEKLDEKVIPNTVISFEGLKAINADVDIALGRIEADNLALSPVKISVQLQDGLLHVDEFTFGDDLGGVVEGVATLDTRPEDAVVNIEISSQNFDIGPVMSVAGYSDLLSGGMQMDIVLASKGKTPRELATGLNGHFQAVLADGIMNAESVEEYFGKGAKAFTDLLTGGGSDEGIAVKCVVADYALTDGVVQTKNMLFDSEVSTILSTGSVDLNEEEIDIIVKPKGDVIGIGAALPVLVVGDFNKTTIIPDPKGTVVAVSGTLLGVVTWPVALAGAVVTHDDEKVLCTGENASAVTQEADGNGKIQDLGTDAVGGVLDGVFGIFGD